MRVRCGPAFCSPPCRAPRRTDGASSPTRWRAAGLEPGDIGGLDDIAKIPPFTSDDIKDDQRDHPPFGRIPGIRVETY